jgi:hypothetical protein
MGDENTSKGPRTVDRAVLLWRALGALEKVSGEERVLEALRGAEAREDARIRVRTLVALSYVLSAVAAILTALLS